MPGPTGVTGTQGLQGLRGLQGPPRYAFQGPPFGYTTARLTTSTPTDGSDKIYLTPENLGTWYNITNNLFARTESGLTIYFPGYFPTYGVGPTGTIDTSAWGPGELAIETTTPHGLREQSLVTVAGMTSNSVGNGTYRISMVLTPTYFQIPVPGGPGNYYDGETGTVTESTAVETTNEAFPTPEQAGNFWLFKNNCDRDRTVTFSGGSPIYQGSAVQSFTLERSYKMTVLYTGSNFIVL